MLKKIPGLKLSNREVSLKMEVSRYSEKEFTIPIKVKNLPQGVRVKLFPPAARVRVTLPLSTLSKIDVSDFSLVVDHKDILIPDLNQLDLKILKSPPSSKKIILNPKQVNYLIRK